MRVKDYPEYQTWNGIKVRCNPLNAHKHPRYSGRGIKVCDAWRGDFFSFLNDMGQRPEPGYTIDRIDNDGDYEPGNCRWANSRTQGINRGIYSTNTSLVKGVTFHKRLKKWQVSIYTKELHRKHIGYFSAKVDAIKARKDAEATYYAPQLI